MATPVRFTDTEQARLIEILQDETDTTNKYVYEPIQRKRRQWDDLYYGKVAPRPKKWLSNFPILFGATATDAILSRLMNTVFAYSPFYTYNPVRNSGWTKVTKTLERYVDFKIRMEMKLYREVRKALFETTRLGTGALLTPWVTKESLIQTKVGPFTIKKKKKTYNFIQPKAIPIRDVRIPGGVSELSESPWWARQLRWTEMMLKKARFEDTYDYVDEALKCVAVYAGADEDEQRKAAERIGEQSEAFKFAAGYEHWVHFDRKKGGDYSKYVVTWSPDTKKIMRIEDDTYPEWPLLLFRYGPRDYGPWGLGVVEMASPFDTALWALYNTLVDNYKIATMQILKARKGRNLSSKTEIYPGKMIFMDDPERDLVTASLGNAFTLNPAVLKMVWDLGERRTGVTDYALGRESPIIGSRATKGGTLALIQEGQRRFDLTIRDIRDQFDDFGIQLLLLMHENLESREAFMTLGADGKYVQEFLEMPRELPIGALSIVSGLSNVATNKEVEKEAAVTSFQIMERYFDKVTQALMMAMDPKCPPELAETIKKMLGVAEGKFERIMATFGDPSPGEYSNILSSFLSGGSENESIGGGGVRTGPGMEEYGEETLGAPGVSDLGTFEAGTPGVP